MSTEKLAPCDCLKCVTRVKLAKVGCTTLLAAWDAVEDALARGAIEEFDTLAVNTVAHSAWELFAKHGDMPNAVSYVQEGRDWWLGTRLAVLSGAYAVPTGGGPVAEA